METEKKKIEVKKVDRKIVYRKPEVKKKFERTILKPGTYVCEYLKTLEVTRNGETSYTHRWKEVTTSNWITGKSATEFTPDSVLHKIFYALGFDLKEGDEINFQDLVGRKCELLISVAKNVNKEDGKEFTYNVIKDYIRLEPNQQSKPAQSTLQ